MKILKRIFFHVREYAKKLQYMSFTPKQTQFIHKNIPYYSQFISRKLVKDFLTGKRKVTEDPKWIESGAKTKEEYEIWAWNGCGMVCLQMILAYKLHKTIPFVVLGKQCLDYGGYTIHEKAKEKHDYKNYYDGLFYIPFLSFIQKEFHLKANIVSPMVYKEIIKELDINNLVIASVHPDIRNPKSSPHDHRGHLVLIVGYDMSKNIFYLHNPSGFYRRSQEFAEIGFKDFTKFFANKGIIIKN